MSFLIAILTILFLSINISYIFHKKFEHILPLVLAAISLILYIFAFFEARPIGIMVILITLLWSIGGAIYCRKEKGYDSIKDTLKSSGIIFVILMIICAFIVSYGFMFTGWDEFSHWGLILKNIFLSGGFGDLGGATTFSYPPGVSLFLSFFTHFSNIISEPNALRGMLFLAFSQTVIVFTKIKFNDWKKILLVSGILFLTPTIFFSSFFSTIYVDAFMGLIFCNILYFSYTYPKKDLFYAIYIGLQFYLLANTKQIGIGLVLIAFLAIIIDYLYSNKIRPLKPFLLNKKNELIYIFVPLVIGILSNLSWSLYIKSHNISEILQTSSIKFSDILNLFSRNIPNYRKETIINFIQQFFVTRQFGTMWISYFLIATISLLVMYYVFRKNKEKGETFNLQLFSFFGLFIYSGMILFTYLFAFSEYEALHLASVERYLGAYLLGLLMLCVFILIDYIIKSHNVRNLSNLKLAALLLFLFCFVPTGGVINDTILSLPSNINRQQMRSAYTNAERYKNILNPNKDRIYIISQNNDGIDYWILGYVFTPIQISPNNRTWSLGKPYSSTDIWTTDETVDEWSKDLMGYTYVYLHNIDDRFVNDYGKLFENASDIKGANLYRIDKTSSGIVLIKV